MNNKVARSSKPVDEKQPRNAENANGVCQEEPERKVKGYHHKLASGSHRNINVGPQRSSQHADHAEKK